MYVPGALREPRSLAGYRPWGRKESDVTEHTHRHTHAGMRWINQSNLAQSVGHRESDVTEHTHDTQTHTDMHTHTHTQE